MISVGDWLGVVCYAGYIRGNKWDCLQQCSPSKNRRDPQLRTSEPPWRPEHEKTEWFESQAFYSVVSYYDDDSRSCISGDDSKFYIHILCPPPRRFLNEDTELLARRTSLPPKDLSTWAYLGWRSHLVLKISYVFSKTLDGLGVTCRPWELNCHLNSFRQETVDCIQWYMTSFRSLYNCILL